MYLQVLRSIRNKMRSAQMILAALAKLFAYHEMCIARVHCFTGNRTFQRFPGSRTEWREGEKNVLLSSALPHPRLAVEDMLVVFSEGSMDGGDCPRVTSSCHCSSKVCEPDWLESCAFLAGGCGFATAGSVLGRGAAILGRCLRCSVRGWQAPRM